MTRVYYKKSDGRILLKTINDDKIGPVYEIPEIIVKIYGISAGQYTSFYWNSDFIEYGWGLNTYGQLGDNTTDAKCVPTSIAGNKKSFCQISAGNAHTLGLDIHGQVWGWGYNRSGQLGNKSEESVCTPVSILGGIKTFCQISAGGTHSAALDNHGQIWCWGYNGYGQLGDNTKTNRCTPVSILGNIKIFCQISIRDNTSYALDNQGQVWTWGRNNNGQIGDNTKTNRCTPVSILGSTKTFCKISGGEYHILAIDNHGMIWSWGSNGNGRLGDNTTINRCTPVSILGSTKTFCQIAADLYSVGIDNHGQVWSWGLNEQGQLGDGTITNRCTPVSILGSTKTFCQISIGDNHTVALDIHNNLWAWGVDWYGKLGDGTTIDRCTPILINI